MIFKKEKYKQSRLYFRIYFCGFPMSKPTRKFEAVFLQIGHTGFWIFRNKKIIDNWPSCSG